MLIYIYHFIEILNNKTKTYSHDLQHCFFCYFLVNSGVIQVTCRIRN
ncbi:hypothetical protein HMPREF0880_01689 [Yokenella regensburgei ATCC 43003]|nr:hypothetical protein HMPREF0880_01689 [Yokenella regensburgei ATCC 43003]